jgi:hypothetical protein
MSNDNKITTEFDRRIEAGLKLWKPKFKGYREFKIFSSIVAGTKLIKNRRGYFTSRELIEQVIGKESVKYLKSKYAGGYKSRYILPLVKKGFIKDMGCEGGYRSKKEKRWELNIEKFAPNICLGANIRYIPNINKRKIDRNLRKLYNNYIIREFLDPNWKAIESIKTGQKMSLFELLDLIKLEENYKEKHQSIFDYYLYIFTSIPIVLCLYHFLKNSNKEELRELGIFPLEMNLKIKDEKLRNKIIKYRDSFTFTLNPKLFFGERRVNEMENFLKEYEGNYDEFS